MAERQFHLKLKSIAYLSNVKLKNFHKIFWNTNKNSVQSPINCKVCNDNGPNRKRCYDGTPWNFVTLEENLNIIYSIFVLRSFLFHSNLPIGFVFISSYFNSLTFQ